MYREFGPHDPLMAMTNEVSIPLVHFLLSTLYYMSMTITSRQYKLVLDSSFFHTVSLLVCFSFFPEYRSLYLLYLVFVDQRIASSTVYRLQFYRDYTFSLNYNESFSIYREKVKTLD